MIVTLLLEDIYTSLEWFWLTTLYPGMYISVLSKKFLEHTPSAWQPCNPMIFQLAQHGTWWEPVQATYPANIVKITSFMNYFVNSLREVNLNRLLGHLKTPVTKHDGEEVRDGHLGSPSSPSSCFSIDSINTGCQLWSNGLRRTMRPC